MLKNKINITRKFQTPEDLRVVLNNYFDETDDKRLTLTDLHMIFGSKQTLSNYLTKPEFKEYRPIIRMAKMIIERSYERTLRESSKVGDIFALKNMGWRDRQELTGKDGKSIPFSIVNFQDIVKKKKKDEGNPKNDPV